MTAMRAISKADAIAVGQTRYFTGRPCKHGHIAERWVSTGICCGCDRMYAAKYKKNSEARRKRYAADYHLKNKEKILKRARDWRKANPERVRELNQKNYWKNVESSRAAGREWRKKNLERKREANRRWTEKNREKARESSRKHYRKNIERQRARSREKHAKNKEKEAEYGRQYRQRFPERHRVSQANRRARLKGSEGSYTPSDINDILRMQNFRCAYCGVKLKTTNMHNDHVEPLARGGSNVRSNIQVTCAKCNIAKGARDPIEFARHLGKLI